MKFSRFMVKKGKVNPKVPLNLALHVDSVPPKFNLAQNKRKIKTTTPPSPSLIKDVKVTSFYFSCGGLGREVLLSHFVLSNIDAVFRLHFVPWFSTVSLGC